MNLVEEARQYIEIIDAQYKEAKEQRVSRGDTEKWGVWSGEMNREIRRKIKERPEEKAARLKLVHFYWTLRSQLLELHYRSRLFGEAKKKQLAKEILKTRELALEDE